MKEYIISVSLTAIIAMIAAGVTPDGKKGELLPYVRLVSSFVIVCVIISPLPRLASCDPQSNVESFIEHLELPDTDFYESNTANALSKLNAAQLESVLTDAVCQKFGTEGDDVKIEVQYTVSDEKTEYTRVLVLLHGKAILKDPKQIEKYVTEISAISCDCVLGQTKGD